MIRVLTKNYKKDDLLFLRNAFGIFCDTLQQKCLNENKSCIKCEYRRACLDMEEVAEFLRRKCND